MSWCVTSLERYATSLWRKQRLSMCLRQVHLPYQQHPNLPLSKTKCPKDLTCSARHSAAAVLCTIKSRGKGVHNGNEKKRRRYHLLERHLLIPALPGKSGQRFFSIPSGSASTERVFSAAGLLSRHHRISHRLWPKSCFSKWIQRHGRLSQIRNFSISFSFNSK